MSAKVGETRSSTSDRHSSTIEDDEDDDKERQRRIDDDTNTKNALCSPGEHPLPTISKNAASLSSAKYAFAHSNHTRNGANSDWRTPRMSSTFVRERLRGSIETCSPLSPIGTWIKAMFASSPSSRCCCCCRVMTTEKVSSIARCSKVCCPRNRQQKHRRSDEKLFARVKKEEKKTTRQKLFRVLNPNTYRVSSSPSFS